MASLVTYIENVPVAFVVAGYVCFCVVVMLIGKRIAGN